MHASFTLDQQYLALVTHLTTDLPKRPIFLLDGGSGSGKTQLANRLYADLKPRICDLQLICLDDFYPGWHGLAQASKLVPELISGRAVGYRRWDWRLDKASQWVEINPNQSMFIVGCGAITPASAALANHTIWYEMASQIRKRLALARDGETYRDWWDVWAAQEERHWRINQPKKLASIWVSRNLE